MSAPIYSGRVMEGETIDGERLPLKVVSDGGNPARGKLVLDAASLNLDSTYLRLDGTNAMAFTNGDGLAINGADEIVHSAWGGATITPIGVVYQDLYFNGTNILPVSDGSSSLGTPASADQGAHMWGAVYTYYVSDGSAVVSPSEIVTTNGDQTISGRKTFSKTMTGNTYSTSSLVIEPFFTGVLTSVSPFYVGTFDNTAFPSTTHTPLFRVYVSGEAWAASVVNGLTLQARATTGTSPLAIASTTLVSNLNAELWGGQTLPTLDSGKFLTNNGSSLSWASVVSTPGGSNTQIQFNDSSSFGGDAGLTYNKTTDALTIAGQIISSLATGTAPFSVTSTTKVDNLNVQYVTGKTVSTSGNAIGLLDGNNTHSGTNLFTNTVTIQDDDSFYIGDNSNASGNLRIWLDINGVGNGPTIESANGLNTIYPYIYMPNMGIRMLDAGTNANVFIGPDIPVPGIVASTTTLLVQNELASGTGTRNVAQFRFSFASSTNQSTNLNAANNFCYYEGTGNLTATGIPGLNGGRNQIVIRTGGTGTVTLAASMSVGMQGQASISPTFTDYAGLLFEAGSAAGHWGGTIYTRRMGIWIPNPQTFGTGGSSVNDYGIRIEAFTRATSNNYEIALETDGGIFFRVPTTSTAATEYIYSSAASTLDIVANTTQNHKIGATTELAITATEITLGSATSDIVNFVSGANGTAPSTTATPTFTAYYGGNTNALGDPNAWLSIKRNGTTYRVPCYT